MSQPAGNCPGCGAPVQFRFSSAVQTTCPYCQSIIVRHDVNLEKVGQVADLPPDASPIQLGTEGIYRNKAFQAVGRIIYEYDQGAWNEWHIIFSDGTSGWLSDAQLEYAVSFLTPTPEPLPQPEMISRDQVFRFGNDEYTVTTKTLANYRGVEGDLPFEYWDKSRVVFADLRTRDAKFGTIDCSENPPILFLGETVEYDALALKNVRLFEGWS